MRPGAPIHIQFLQGGRLIQKNEAGGKAVRVRQGIQRIEHGGPAFLGKAVDAERADPLPAQLRHHAAHQLFAADERVEVHGRQRQSDRLLASRGVEVQVGEQGGVCGLIHGIVAQPLHLESRGKCVLQRLDIDLKRLQRLFQGPVFVRFPRRHTGQFVPGEVGLVGGH